LRSTSLGSIKGVLVALVWSVAAAAAAACGESSLSDSSYGGSPDDTSQDPANDSGASSEEDATSPPTLDYRGSPLCHVRTTASTCMPDDTGTNPTEDVAACSTEPDADNEDARIQGCRLVRTDSSIVPECADANPEGTDGKSCVTGEDCAPGFDCVKGKNGPSCRRYCCEGSCDNDSRGLRFCDVQRLIDSQTNAPVCMPLIGCELLKPDTCVEGETCAVVSNGDAGCVTIGQASAGGSCEDTHCATGLTCLGAHGNRKCYELCRITQSTCGAEQTCKTSALFDKNPDFGVCSPLPP
jgi:hypothetical protein